MTGLTFEEIERMMPDDRRELSFGGPDETVIDVMEKMDEENHHNGKHMDEPRGGCPFCPDPENKHVAVEIASAEVEK